MCLRPNHSPNAGWSNNDGAVNICLIRLQEWNIIYHVFFLRFGTADRLGKWSFMFFSHALQQVRKIIFRVFFSRFATAATYGKWSLIFFFFIISRFSTAVRCENWSSTFSIHVCATAVVIARIKSREVPLCPACHSFHVKLIFSLTFRLFICYPTSLPQVTEMLYHSLTGDRKWCMHPYTSTLTTKNEYEKRCAFLQYCLSAMLSGAFMGLTSSQQVSSF